MQPYRPNLGATLDLIETPSLLIDLELMESNFDVISKTYSNTLCKMRQHAKNIKCPDILWRQIEIGGTLNGVCTAKVSEAEVMVEGGIRDVLITSEIVGEDKQRRLAYLAKRADVKVCIDNETNLNSLSLIAQEIGSEIGVLIEVDTSMGRAGIRTAEQGVELAKLAESLASIKFLGVMSHQTVDGFADKETRFIEGKRYIDKCLAVKTAIEDHGIEVTIVSSGETFSYDVAPQIEGVTEVEGGTYALMSGPAKYMEEFSLAGKVLTTVIDVTETEIVIDAGLRCLGGPLGVTPTIEGHDELTFIEMHDSYSVLSVKGENIFRIGQTLFICTSQQDILVNRWDNFIGVRDGVVEAVWDISARGCHH